MREIDRIATDDATIVVIGFNKFSLWSLIKIFSSKPPWNINFLSPYIIKEWFKILEYKTNYQKTFGFIPYLGKNVTSFLSNISFLHKIIRNQFGVLYVLDVLKLLLVLDKKNVRHVHLAPDALNQHLNVKKFPIMLVPMTTIFPALY